MYQYARITMSKKRASQDLFERAIPELETRPDCVSDIGSELFIDQSQSAQTIRQQIS